MRDLRDLVEGQYGCQPTFREVPHVAEPHKSKMVWEGDVSVFEVDYKDASTDYAWADSVPASTRVRYFAVLGTPPINSASDVVRAAIAARWRNEVGR